MITGESDDARLLVERAQEKLTLQGIKQWAQSKPAYEVLGSTGMACGCPIYVFLTETVPPIEMGMEWRVDTEEIYLASSLDKNKSPVRSFRLPGEIARLVRAIDYEIYSGNEQSFGEDVNSDQLLKVIHEVETQERRTHPP